MSSDERARVALYERLDETLGRDAADTLMGYLPPVGWADVATKHDLLALEQRMDLRFEAVDHRVDSLGYRLEAQFERALRQVVLALVAAMVASVGAAVGITQLLT